MLRCTVLRAVVGVLAVVLLVAVPNLALGQQSDFGRGQRWIPGGSVG
jgi:hypothetical protein